jgi:DNA polymerase epsilon subunit 1
MSLFYEGFELKRRGELQLTKAFQSQIFEKFLEGYHLFHGTPSPLNFMQNDSCGMLSSCWLSGQSVAGYTLQQGKVLHVFALFFFPSVCLSSTLRSELSDEEIFELLSETRSMSRELGDYGAQKSPTITAAKRLGEFLGSDTLRGKGLSCKFIISEKVSLYEAHEEHVNRSLTVARRVACG